MLLFNLQCMSVSRSGFYKHQILVRMFAICNVYDSVPLIILIYNYLFPGFSACDSLSLVEKVERYQCIKSQLSDGTKLVKKEGIKMPHILYSSQSQFLS